MIKVNKDAQIQLIQRCADSVYRNIEEKAAEGFNNIEVFFPSSIYRDACDLLEERFKKEGLNFTWNLVRRALNPHTGRTSYFATERIDGCVRKVLRLL